MKKKYLFFLCILLVCAGCQKMIHSPVPPPATPASPPPATPPVKIEFTFTLYFLNNIKDPNLIDCTLVYPVVRKSMDQPSPEFIMNQLIKGPSDQEKKEGYVSGIPKECRVNFVSISNGKVIVDFKPFHIAGSCATGAFTAQVKQTALRFPFAREVQITIQGKSKEILQP